MPNEIDDLIAEISAGKRTEKGPYQPAKGEEAIFAAPEKKGMFDLTDPVMPFLMAMPKGLLETIGPLIPGYQQVAGEIPWRDPQGSLTKSIMDMAFIASGFATPGRGMAKSVMQKGGTSLRTALSEIGSELFGKGGVPATIERGPLPALGGGRFTRRPGETVDISDIARGIQKEVGIGAGAKQLAKRSVVPTEAPASSLAEQKLIETAAQKRLPQYAGPTAPRGIPQPYAPQTWRERTFPGSIQRAQDVIEDLFRESLRAKGMID